MNEVDVEYYIFDKIFGKYAHDVILDTPPFTSYFSTFIKCIYKDLFNNFLHKIREEYKIDKIKVVDKQIRKDTDSIEILLIHDDLISEDKKHNIVDSIKKFCPDMDVYAIYYPNTIYIHITSNKFKELYHKLHKQIQTKIKLLSKPANIDSKLYNEISQDILNEIF